MAKDGSTLPPKKDGAKPRARKPASGDLPKCGLPSGKRKAKGAVEGKPGMFVPDAAVPPVLDIKQEVEDAKLRVLARTGAKAKVPIDPPIDHDVREKLDGAKPKRKAKAKPAPDPVPEDTKKAPRLSPMAARLAELKVKRPPMSPELFADICLLVSEGIPLREICRSEGMPSKSCFYEYLEDASDETIHAGRVARYARARALGFDELAAETLEIVDDGANDYIERRLEDGTVEAVLDREHIQRSKLRAEHRLKLLACWDPKRYGAQLKLADPNGERLDRASLSNSDIAIWISKITVAIAPENNPAGPLLEG